MIHLNLSGDFVYNEPLFNYALLFSQTVGSSLNLFTLFVIYSYRGPELKNYRWHLFLYQVIFPVALIFVKLFSMLLDFCMDTMAQPVFFFPHVAGTAQGWLRTVFRMPTFTVYVRISQRIARNRFLQTVMMTFGAVCLHFICFSPLYYRWQLVIPESSYFKFSVSYKFF